MKKITTSKAANEAAKKVAEYIKCGWTKEVEDTEILVYWEDGRYTINVRAYFKKGKEIDGRGDYQVLKAMQQFGIVDAEAVLLQEDDGYKTYCGYSNWCDKEPDTTIADVRRIFKAVKFTPDITATIVTKDEPFPTLYIQSNANGLGKAVRHCEGAAKILRTMLKGKAKIAECWVGEAKNLPRTKQQTCTHAYKITLV